MSDERKHMKWWDEFCALPRFSFWRGADDEECRVVTVADDCGKWVDRGSMQVVADEVQSAVNCLESEIEAKDKRIEELEEAMENISEYADCMALHIAPEADPHLAHFLSMVQGWASRK